MLRPICWSARLKSVLFALVLPHLRRAGPTRGGCAQLISMRAVVRPIRCRLEHRLAATRASPPPPANWTTWATSKTIACDRANVVASRDSRQPPTRGDSCCRCDTNLLLLLCVVGNDSLLERISFVWPRETELVALKSLQADETQLTSSCSAP